MSALAPRSSARVRSNPQTHETQTRGRCHCTAVTPVNRWKLVSVVLAGCLSYSWWHGDAVSSPPPAAQGSRFKGPIRVSAAALGISSDELLRRLFAAKDITEIRELAEKLGAIGNDRMIDEVMPLVADKREGVPETIIQAFGVIATEHAVDVLIELAKDKPPAIRTAAVDALAETKNRRAEPMIIELAQ